MVDFAYTRLIYYYQMFKPDSIGIQNAKRFPEFLTPNS